MYAKVIKWISWVLLILGAVIGVYGFIVGFDDNSNAPVDYVLYWAYAWWPWRLSPSFSAWSSSIQ